MTSEITGGFVGDIEEAFTPPASQGCCGQPAPATKQEAETVAVSCCGSPAEAGQAAASGCCGQAPAATTGCCG
ncbi:MAG: hypothetical protein HOV83_20205 [Catenulispora sp.]|nr:hypothetical protein [Catenulispora sp.]